MGAMDIANRVAAVEWTVKQKVIQHQEHTLGQGLRTGTARCGSASDHFSILAYLLEFPEDAVVQTSFWPLSLILVPLWHLFTAFERQISAAPILLKTKD